VDEEEKEKRQLSRRDFLYSIGNVAILSVIGVFVGFPTVELFLSHTKPGQEGGGFIPVADVAELTKGAPLLRPVKGTRRDAWEKFEDVNLGSVWLVKEGDGSIKAFSSICPHLGCIYNWDREKKDFLCPCHLSAFSLEGKVLSGPSPRPLDTLPLKIQRGQVLVKYERFISGISQKKVV
jgi:menaquinol-cytochrome c reductase iron-sulfur subunit